MIIADEDNERVIFAGTLDEIGDDMINIMEKFTKYIAETPEGKELVSAMFEADPEIVTNFMKTFVKSTH